MRSRDRSRPHSYNETQWSEYPKQTLPLSPISSLPELALVVEPTKKALEEIIILERGRCPDLQSYPGSLGAIKVTCR